MKKLPLLGLVIGLVAAAFAILKKRKGGERPEDTGAA